MGPRHNLMEHLHHNNQLEAVGTMEATTDIKVETTNGNTEGIAEVEEIDEDQGLVILTGKEGDMARTAVGTTGTILHRESLKY